MTNLQNYLRENSLDQLKEELSIRVYEHPQLDLLGFKYNQIDSPRSHPVVKECRGIVLEKESWNLVAKPFDRFFNLGEFEGFKTFNWNEFDTTEKVDGSLIILYYYKGDWHMNTSGSFGLQKVSASYEGNWRKLFREAANLDFKKLSTHNTYLFELCSPHNKIVKLHKKPRVYLIGVVFYRDLHEVLVDEWADYLNLARPERHHFTSQEEVKEYLTEKSKLDKTYEGVIIRDKSSRWKWKTETYVALHHLKDNGNILLPKRLIPLVLAGEIEETIAYLPEIKSAVMRVKEKLDKNLNELESLYTQYKDIEDQKEFALAVKDHQLSGMLFLARKTKKPIKEVFNNPKTLEKLFGKEQFTYD